MSDTPGRGYAKFMEHCGHPVIEVHGRLFHRTTLGIYMSVPYYLPFDIDPVAAAAVTRSLRISGLRYPSSHAAGLPSGIYVCRTRTYGMQSLSRNFRAKVRHGLESCDVRAVTESELLTEGLAINRQTMQRQNRFDSDFGSPAKWRRIVSAIENSPCMAAIGAFVDGHLASYAITCTEDGWLQILHKMNSMNYDHLNPSHVLDFTLTRRIAESSDVTAVSMGWAPLVENSGLHEYKKRLGYDLEDHKSVIYLHPALNLVLVNSLTRGVLTLLQRVLCKSHQLEMAAAVINGAASSRIRNNPEPVTVAKTSDGGRKPSVAS